MFSLKKDTSGSKLIIRFKGHFDLQQAEEFYNGIQEILPRLRKGLSILTDLSSLEQMDTDTKHFIGKVMDLLNKHGVSKVIRVIPDQDKDIGLSIMSLFHYSTEVPIHTYRTYRQAKVHFK